MKAPALTLLLSTLISLPALAGEVTGDKAAALRNGLVKNGAELERHIEIARVKVSGVRCSSALTGRGIFGSCEMKDNISGRVIRVSDRDERGNNRPVRDLILAMREAGAKVEDRAGGSSIDARSIECTVGHIRGHSLSSCTLKN